MTARITKKLIEKWITDDGVLHASERDAQAHLARQDLDKLLERHLNGMTASASENDMIRDQVAEVLITYREAFNDILCRLQQ